MSMNLSKAGNLSFAGAFLFKTPNQDTKNEVNKRIKTENANQPEDAIKPSVSTENEDGGVKLIYSYPEGTDAFKAKGYEWGKLQKITKNLVDGEALDEAIEGYDALSTDKTYEIPLNSVRDNSHKNRYFSNRSPIVESTQVPYQFED